MPLDMPGTVQRLAVTQTLGADSSGDDSSRTIRFVLSDSSVARDGHTLATKGWDVSSYLKNPVVLFGHDSSSVDSVIGRMTNITTQGDQLVGTVEFMPADVNPTAETVFQMVKRGYLNAVSVGFIPTEGKPAKGRGAGAYDFSKQELLEVSVVPVPALPTALAEARAAGIDTTPITAWAKRIMETEAMTELPTPSPAALRAPPILKRDLYDVSWLASLLLELAYIQSWAEAEAEQEGDGSPVPAQLLEALKTLGQILIDMTAEEVGELLADHGVEQEVAQDQAQGAIDHMALGFKRLVIGAVRAVAGKSAAKISASRLSGMDTASIAHALRADLLSKSGRAALADLIETRSGRVLNADNEGHLRNAHDCLSRAAGHVKTVLDTVASDADDSTDNGSDDTDTDSDTDTDGDAEARAHRARKAKAIKLKS